jgi:hypothetical protein
MSETPEHNRDHKRLGRELELFTFSDTVGKGLPLWLPKGATVRRELERFIVDEEIKRGYQHVLTPDIAKLDLYKKSGHYPYYADSMYAPIKIDDDEFMLRPMTCPHHPFTSPNPEQWKNRKEKPTEVHAVCYDLVPEALLLVLGVNTEHVEHFALQHRVVNADGSGAEFIAVEHYVQNILWSVVSQSGFLQPFNMAHYWILNIEMPILLIAAILIEWA